MKTLIVSSTRENWARTARFANIALKYELKVEWALEAFRQPSRVKTEKTNYAAGTYLIILDNVDAHSSAKILDIAQTLEIRTEVIRGSISCKKTKLTSARVCIYADAGSPYPFVSALSESGFDLDPITADQIRKGRLSEFDVLIIPGGGDEGPPRQSELLGEKGRSKIRKFLMGGGNVWGSCAGCCNLILYAEDKSPWAANYEDWKEMRSLNVINSEYWDTGMTGVGKLKVSNLQRDHPLMFGLPNEFELTWHLGPLLSLARAPYVRKASKPIPFIQAKGFTSEWTAAEYLNSPNGQAFPKALERTYAGRGIKAGKYGLIAGYYGRGKVVACAAHPEFGLDPFLEQRGVAARTLSNFLFWATSGKSAKSIVRGVRRSVSYKHYRACTRPMRNIIGTIEQDTDALLRESTLITEPIWLRDNIAASTFGLTAAQKWRLILRRMSELPSEIKDEANELDSTVDNLNSELDSLLKMLKRADQKSRKTKLNTVRNSRLLEQEVHKIFEWVQYVPGAEQDYGWQGALALLASASRKIRKSVENYGLEPTAHSIWKNPYDLIWDYYLGALFDLMNAKCLLRARRTLAVDRLVQVNSSFSCKGPN